MKPNSIPPAIEPRGGWQAIETAPKDGTPVLIWQPGATLGDFAHQSVHMPPGALRPGECSYRTDDPRLQRYDDARFAIGYWRPWGGWGNRNSATVKPTHWQPLPPPPSGLGSTGGGIDE